MKPLVVGPRVAWASFALELSRGGRKPRPSPATPARSGRLVPARGQRLPRREWRRGGGGGGGGSDGGRERRGSGGAYACQAKTLERTKFSAALPQFE